MCLRSASKNEYHGLRQIMEEIAEVTQARVPGDTDCGHPCATDHGGNCGKSANHTTGARAESHGQIVGVPTPQIQDEIAAIQLIPQECISERILEQTRRCSSPSDSRTNCRNLEDHPTGLGSAAHGGADC